MKQIPTLLLGTFGLMIAQASSAQTYTLSSQFGSTGSGSGQFNLPSFVAIDPTNHHVVVADTGNSRVQIFDAQGIFLSEFGTAGTGDGEFASAPSSTDQLTATEQLPGPAGVAIDPTSHNIVVVDGGNARLQVFDASGNYLSQFRTADHLNSAPIFTPGQNNATWFPADVAIDGDTHNIVVSVSNFYWDTDYYFACVRITIDYGWVTTLGVQTFAPSGEYLSQFQDPNSYCNGQSGYTYPRTVAIDSKLHHIVLGNKSGGVEVFDSSGVLLREIAIRPTAVAVDPRNANIVILSENQIQIFTSTGLFQQKFATGGGTGTHPTTGFSGIAIDPTNGNIVVVDPSNNRIEIFAPNPSGGSAIVGPAVALSPGAALEMTPPQMNGTTPTYSWNADAAASTYTVWVGKIVGAAGVGLLYASYTAAEAGCPAGTGACAITPATALTPGDTIQWALFAANDFGAGPWSSALHFVVAGQ